jgi:hypothetical protein
VGSEKAIKFNASYMSQVRSLLAAIPPDLISGVSVLHHALDELKDATNDPAFKAAVDAFQTRWVSALRMMGDGTELAHRMVESALQGYEESDTHSARLIQGASDA